MPSKSRAVLFVDTASVAVSLFYAMGGNRFLTEDAVDPAEATKFLAEVADTTVENILRKITLDKYRSPRLALEAHPSSGQWRYAIYPDYKYASSKPRRPRIAAALQKYVIKVGEARGLQFRWAPGLEGDDVISVMVKKLPPEFWDTGEVFIWTNDGDMQQLLVNEHVKIIGKGGELLTRDGAMELWGVDPSAIPLVKALAGDKSDNIIGVHGIGRKKAVEIIRPAPYAKPVPWVVDVERLSAKLPPEEFREFMHLLPRIQRDTEICTLANTGELLTGEAYLTYTGG